jgi:hypothetical protein
MQVRGATKVNWQLAFMFSVRQFSQAATAMAESRGTRKCLLFSGLGGGRS